MRRAVYAFSGDPITNGHINIVERVAKVFDEIVVGIGNNPLKKYLFKQFERKELAEKTLSHLSNVKVKTFTGMLSDFIYEEQAQVVIRGLRNTEDFNFEMMLHQVIDGQQLDIDTFLIPAQSHLNHVSSGMVKAIQLEHGQLQSYVPLPVKQQLECKISGQLKVGITGEVGMGKSLLATQIKKHFESVVPVHIIDADCLARHLLNEPNRINTKTKEDVIALFKNKNFKWEEIRTYLYKSPETCHQFNKHMLAPMLAELRRALYGKRGLILIESALFSELNLSHLTNNFMVLVQSTKLYQTNVLKARGLSYNQIKYRLKFQSTNLEKKQTINKMIEMDKFGELIHYKGGGLKNLEPVLEPIKKRLEALGMKLSG